MSDGEHRITQRFLESLACHIPFQSMLTEHDVVTTRGELMRIWRVCDLNASASTARWLHRQHGSLCPQLRRATNGRFALWLHRLPRSSIGNTPHHPTSPSARLHETYISVVLRPGWRATFGWYIALKATHMAYANEVRAMKAASAAVAEHLEALRPQLLGDYFVDGRHHNETFDFLSFLVNGVWTSRPVVAGPLYRTLPCTDLIQSSLNASSTSGSDSQLSLHLFPDWVSSERLCCGAEVVH